MVSRNMNPADGSFLDPNGTMTVPAIGPFSTSSSPTTSSSNAVDATTSSEDMSKKTRKPYTMIDLCTL
ncbi:hypothetical protein HA466_0011010 [Hirschfeldia incana]|nr:hypothetical protein HA466_0011010 [Hirschfeldia incana]